MNKKYYSRKERKKEKIKKKKPNLKNKAKYNKTKKL